MNVYTLQMVASDFKNKLVATVSLITQINSMIKQGSTLIQIIDYANSQEITLTRPNFGKDTEIAYNAFGYNDFIGYVSKLNIINILEISENERSLEHKRKALTDQLNFINIKISKLDAFINGVNASIVTKRPDMEMKFFAPKNQGEIILTLNKNVSNTKQVETALHELNTIIHTINRLTNTYDEFSVTSVKDGSIILTLTSVFACVFGFAQIVNSCYDTRKKQLEIKKLEIEIEKLKFTHLSESFISGQEAQIDIIKEEQKANIIKQYKDSPEVEAAYNAATVDTEKYIDKYDANFVFFFPQEEEKARILANQMIDSQRELKALSGNQPKVIEDKSKKDSENK